MEKFKCLSLICMFLCMICFIQHKTYAKIEENETKDVFEINQNILSEEIEKANKENKENTANENQEQFQVANTLSVNTVKSSIQEVEDGLKQLATTENKSIYIQSDVQHVYYLATSRIGMGETAYYYFEIIKQDINTGEENVIFGDGVSRDGKYNTNPYEVLKTYVYEDIIYIECGDQSKMVEGDKRYYPAVTVFGIDTQKEQKIYQKEFDVTVYTADLYPSFAVDKDQRFYFVSNYGEIKIYNHDGTLNYSNDIKFSDDRGEIEITSVSPSGKVLFYSVNAYRSSGNKGIIYQGIQKLNNGKFVNSQFTVTSANGMSPVWYFLDDQEEYAVNQYGEVAQFSYDDSSDTGVSYTILKNVNAYREDGYYTVIPYPTYAMKDNYVYLIGRENEVYILDKSKNFELVGRIENIIDEEETNTYIRNVSLDGNKLNIFYSVSPYLYLKTIDLDTQEIVKKQNIVYSTHSSQNHTKDQIEDTYKTNILFDYTKNIYSTQPNYSAPYSEGVLEQEVVTDTLNRINFYRWLYGVDDVTINSSKMARNQKGALLLKVNNQLSHTPSKPEGMTEDFYQEAYLGCNARYAEGDTYSGNVASSSSPLYTHIDNYISDIKSPLDYSVNEVGHRLSILDPYAYETSFGCCSPYSTLSMYYDDSNTEALKEDFYAYPTAGNFPKKLFLTHQKWSLYFTHDVTFEDGYKLEFIYNGKSYAAEDMKVENSYPAITFAMPIELKNLLNSSSSTMPECEITVKLSGVTDEKLNDVTYQYSVNFFAMQDDLLKGDVNKDGKVKIYDALMILKQSILGGNLDDDMLYIMDYNDDGKVRIYDALKFLQQAILG